jgi:hypothetical protein
MTGAGPAVVADIQTYPRGADDSVVWESSPDGFWAIVHRPSLASIPAVMLDALSMDNFADVEAFRRWAAALVGSTTWNSPVVEELGLVVTDLVGYEEATRLRTAGIHVNRTRLWRIQLDDRSAIVYSRVRTWVVRNAPANQPPLRPAA